MAGTALAHGEEPLALRQMRKADVWMTVSREHAGTLLSHRGSYHYAQVDAGEEIYPATVLGRLSDGAVLARGLTYTDWSGNDAQTRGVRPTTPDEIASTDNPRTLHLDQGTVDDLASAGYLFCRKVSGYEDGVDFACSTPAAAADCPSAVLSRGMLEWQREDTSHMERLQAMLQFH
eukprot:TRINITY_DN14961_c0_g1_i2.p2 TRINITY_DN14961_c0_g1~~TRINITY_DN14961_c0_g1_i2.p2  ORF type:complete len:176 (+),score=67.27 TRINITY_DN14961_c0_g1_i2:478-1005(+)